MSNIQFFLGANTPHGFKSLFNELYDPYDDWQMYIIKGGPGTGKSSLMKGIAIAAENRGLAVERVPCSSDPLSLDAIIISEIKVAIADGTAPHIVDPVFPGVCEQTINLGQYWDAAKLKSNAEDIRRITIQNKEEHKKCVKYMKASSIINAEILDIINKYVNYDKIERLAVRMSEKEFGGKRNKPCKIQHRYLSAVTPLGIAVQYDTMLSMCNRVIEINDNYGVASPILLTLLFKYAKMKNLDIIVCNCPMDSDNKIEHLIFPELMLGFFTSNNCHPLIFKPEKIIHAERFLDNILIENYSNKINFTKKAKMDLLSESIKHLEAAKTAHDVLESYYISAMDFSGVAQEKNNIINTIFK